MKHNAGFLQIAIGLAILSVIFFLIERVIGRNRRRPILRRGWFTDVCFWFFTPLVTKVVSRGANVILITSANHPEHHGINMQRVDTSSELLAEMRSQLGGADLLLMAAAVGDFRPAKTAARKIRREETPSLTLELEPIPDLIASLAADESLAGVFRIAFAAEDSDLDTKGMEKMKRKGVQAIVANDISRRDVGFGSDYNAGVLLFADGSRFELEKATKREMSDRILDLVLPRLKKR